MVRWFWILTAGLLVVGALSVAGGAPAGPALEGGNVRVSNQDLITTDAFFSQVGPPPEVLQQNEPSVAVHPTNPNLVAVGMNDVRTLGLSNDAWQGLAVSTNGGASFAFEALIPGFPGDTSPQGLVSPIRGNRAASDPWLGFDPFGNLFFAFIAFQRTPPGRPDFEPQDTNAIAVARYRVTGSGVVYDKTVVVERGTVGLGRQEDKEALAVDTHARSPYRGNVYVCWARFTGAQDHLKVAVSSDHGESYRLATIATASRTVLMQGCSLAVAPNGDVFVAWRTFDVNPLVPNPRDSAVFVAKSTNGGQTFGPAVEVARFVDYRQNASRTPPVFRTFALTSIAADENGVYVAWQQRGPGGDADIVISRSRDGGQTWEPPVRPYTDSPPAHQIMPSVAAAGGKLSVVWYDSRSEPAFTPRGPISGSCPSNATDGTGCRGLEVFYAQADTTAPGSLQFGPALQITSQSFNPNLYGSIKAISPFIGDYIMVSATQDTAFVVWTDNRNINPTRNAQEDADVTTDPPGLINFRSRDSNVYFQRVRK